MDTAILVNLFYIASSILFIVGLKMLGSPDTARRGNLLSSSGMLLAVLITLLDQNIIDYRYIAGALIAGSIVGYFAATKVKMTSMPEMVAIFNGFGGIASLLVGSAEYVSGTFDNPAFLGAIFLTVLIGGLTFSGSIIAYGKLSEVISGKPYLYKGQQFVNGILLLAILLVGINMLFIQGFISSEETLILLIVLAFILGIIGMFYHAYRDEKMAFSVMSLFIMTGYAIILYLNQDDPQPRERDYSYVGSFFAFSIWIGVGTAAISEWISGYVKNTDMSKKLISIALIFQILFIPTVMARANYHSHDRSGNYVAWDYSYNILQSCGPNGVIFTNGDNDTFPLWYLQEVEKVRTDVAVVNLSLLNTPWYIKQWRDKRSNETRFITLTDRQIDKLTSSLQRWEKQKVKVPVYGDPQNEKGFITTIIYYNTFLF